ncbi:MAG: TetR/AcrR family transcriptional regulator [Burkholderiales bacterium]
MSTAARAATKTPSAAPNRRTKREQRDESVDKLLSAARSLFVKKGYRATTLEQVASAAGLTKGAVYFHFGAKEAVLVQLLAAVEAQLIAPALDILKSPGSPAFDKFGQFLRMHGEMGVTKQEDMLLLISMSIEFAEQEGTAAEAIKRMYNSLHSAIEALIKRGQASGEFRRDAPAAELSSIVIATHDGAFLEWYRRKSKLDGRNLVRAVVSVLMHGL